MGAAMITSLPSCCAGPNIVVHSSEETEGQADFLEPRTKARMLPLAAPMENGREDTNLDLDSPEKRVQAAEDIHYGHAGIVRKGATGTVAGMLKGANGGGPNILVHWDAFSQLSKVSVTHEQIQFMSPELPGPYVITHEAGVTRAVTLSRDTLGILPVGATVQIVEVIHLKQDKRWRGRLKEPISGWISLLATDTGHRWAVQEHILPTLAPAEVPNLTKLGQANNVNGIVNGNSQAPAAAAAAAAAPTPLGGSTGVASMRASMAQQTQQRPRTASLPQAASFSSASGLSHHGQGASAPSRAPMPSFGPTSLKLQPMQPGGTRPGACVRTASFESQCSIRSGHSSVSMSSQPAYYPVGARGGGSRANSLPASLHGSVHFSVDGQPMARVPSDKYIIQATDPLRQLSNQYDDPSRMEDRHSTASSNSQVHHRPNPQSARCSANPSWARGQFESLTRPLSWTGMDLSSNGTHGCASVPEGPRVSPRGSKPEKGQVMALGAQPGGPRGTSSDARPGSEVYV